MNNIYQDSIWITWEHQVRNRSMAKALGCELFEYNLKGSRITRYVKLTLTTLLVLRSKKPKIVFHQNPSIALTFLLIIVKKPFGFKTVMDCHNAGAFPMEGRSKVLNLIAKMLLKFSDVVITHNREVGNYVEPINQNTYILSDPLPGTPKVEDNIDYQAYGIFSCSWSEDEPYEELFEACELLTKSHPHIKILCTGKPPESVKKNTNLPKNIELTGFISYERYQLLLQNCLFVIALTKRNNSLNCAAYEAIAYRRPCLISDSPILKETFYKGFVYTPPKSAGIFQGISKLVDTKNNLTKQIDEMHTEYKESWNHNFEEIKQTLDKL